MNILDRLPFLASTGPDDEVLASAAAEHAETEARKERIEFHRSRVRNGPVNFKAPTTGQIRRAQQRHLDRQTKRARRAAVRKHLAEQKEAATLAAQLRHAGILAFSQESYETSPERARRAVIWIVQRYAEGDETGRVEVTREVVLKALEAALNRWQTLVGRPVTPLSPAYVLPVRLA